MTLHEAILTVIRKNGEAMKPRDIALEINKFSLYKSKSEKPISANQVWARANNYKNILQITSDKRITEASYEIAEQEEFLKWVRNFVTHSYGVEYEILLPYMLLLFRMGKLQDDGRMFCHDIFESDNPKATLSHTLEKIFTLPLPEEFYFTIKSAIETCDEQGLKHLIDGFGRFYDYLIDVLIEDFRQLFKKTILLLSSTKSRNFEFGTPLSLAKFIRHLVDIKSEQAIYDPFAGLCVLLSEVATKAKRVNVLANDLNKRVGVLGIMNLLISEIEGFTYTFEDAFQTENIIRKDWIISNPPFSRFSLSRERNNRYGSSNAVELIYSRLANKSKALIIVPDSFLFSGDRETKYLRRELIKARAIRSIISLPNGIFSPFSGVATSIIILEKGVENNEIYLADLSDVSNDEFEYKSEEYASWFKRKIAVDSKSAIVNAHTLAEDEEYNLLPRRLILKFKVDKGSKHNSVPLKDLIKRKIVGKNVSSSNLNEQKDGVPYLRISDFMGIEGVLSTSPRKYISDIELIQPIRHFVEPGTFVIARVGSTIRPVIYNYSEPAVPSTNLLCFTIDEEKINPSFLIAQLSSESVKQQLDAIQIRGAGPNFFREKDLLDLRIPLPNKKKQQEETIGMFGMEFEKFFDSLHHIRPKGNINVSFENLFFENNRKATGFETPTSKIAREKEIISSIKHRISQYVSPISSDLQNLNFYYRRKSEDGTRVSLNDKISARESAGSIEDVFHRMKENLKGIGDTFDLMSKILYYNKEDSKIVKADIREVIDEAYESVKDRLDGVIYNFSFEFNLKDEDFIVPLDKKQIIELLRNFFINSVKHGFDQSISKKIISIFISKSTNQGYLELNLINNGKPFPEGYSLDDFTNFGTKGTDSDGTGIGGYLMKKIVENHEGKLEWFGDQSLKFSIEDENDETIVSVATIHFQISLPYFN